jgi:hypothetical protein
MMAMCSNAWPIGQIRKSTNAVASQTGTALRPNNALRFVELEISISGTMLIGITATIAEGTNEINAVIGNFGNRRGFLVVLRGFHSARHQGQTEDSLPITLDIRALESVRVACRITTSGGVTRSASTLFDSAHGEQRFA